MPSIDGIDINASTIENCYKMFYPDTHKRLVEQNRFHYLELWGIRMSTCDTSLPDDFVGGIRVNNFNFLEVVAAAASTDPSPKYVQTPVDSGARRAGGTAYVKEGQHTYRYIGKNHEKWRPYPAFCPTKPMPVYRWNPTAEQIKLAKQKRIPLSSFFDDAVKKGRVIISKSSDTCIHRAWSRTNLYGDSAGCQVFSELEALNTLGSWATAHINKKYGNLFIYTLFTKEQFLKANKSRNLQAILRQFIPAVK